MDLYSDFLKLWEGRADFARHPVARDTPLECVIVEPREHENLAGVLANVSCILPNAALTIVHSRENADFVRKIIGDTDAVKCFEMFDGNINRNEYCTLLSEHQFWLDKVESENVLIFQTDTGLRRNKILRYMEYDYIGAPWSWTVASDPRICIGNGGLSLRNRALMGDICLRYQRDPTYTDESVGEPEDIFFARHLIDCDEARLPTWEEASSFAVEHCQHEDPFGFHQAYKFYPRDVVGKWLDPDNLDVPIIGGNDLIKIREAYIETANGLIIEDSALKSWLSLGINAHGLRIPAHSRMACIKRDPAMGQRKLLKIILERPDSSRYECRIVLDRNRTPTDFFFPSI
jgi:Protein of unknown function (DUF5672)